MAVSASGSSPEPREPKVGAAGSAVAPGRHQAFEIEPRRTPLYRVERMIFVTALWTWFRPEVAGASTFPRPGR